MSNIIEGRNPVIEALKNKRPINKLMIVNGEKQGSIKKVIAMAKEQGIVISYVDRMVIDKASESDNHQGVLAYTSEYEYFSVADILATAEEKGEDPFVIICDEIEDPHNLGSILRTANAVGAHGVIIPKRRAVQLTPVVGKTSAGAIEYVKVARVTNLKQAIEQLKEAGLWIYGADMGGDSYYKTNMTGKVGLIIGSEGNGMSKMIKKACDHVVSIPMAGEVSSLNASVAGSILMYEVYRQRHG